MPSWRNSYKKEKKISLFKYPRRGETGYSMPSASDVEYFTSSERGYGTSIWYWRLIDPIGHHDSECGCDSPFGDGCEESSCGECYMSSSFVPENEISYGFLFQRTPFEE